MLSAPIPVDDADRVAELDKLDLAYIKPQAIFDRATKLLSTVFDAPAVMVNLIDEDHQYLKSYSGMSAQDIHDRVVPREISVCGHVVAGNQSLVIEDLLADERFRDNPMVRAKGLRFYAGAPLHAENGQPIGALCVVDFKPRKMSESELRLLELLADGMMAELRRRAVAQQLLDRSRAMERDLAAARAVQRVMLPPARQETDRFALWHLYHPTDAIGGDFLDSNICPNGSVALMVADVSGHGTSAALTSAMVKSIFQRAAATASGPQSILTAVNDELCTVIESGQFITAVSAIYQPARRTLLMASAGHPMPILLRAGHAEELTISNDLPLLIETGHAYDCHTARPVDSGDRILFYTDGASEAMNAAGDMLEGHGLAGIVQANAHLSGEAFLVSVFRAIREFSGEKLKDDVALVCLEIK